MSVTRARKKFPRLRVEVECNRLSQVRQAAAADADVILLDNMTPVQMRASVRLAGKRAKLEASGGVTAVNERFASPASDGNGFAPAIVSSLSRFTSGRGTRERLET